MSSEDIALKPQSHPRYVVSDDVMYAGNFYDKISREIYARDAKNAALPPEPADNADDAVSWMTVPPEVGFVERVSSRLSNFIRNNFDLDTPDITVEVADEEVTGIFMGDRHLLEVQEEVHNHVMEVQEKVHSYEVDVQEEVYSDEVDVQEEVYSDKVEVQEEVYSDEVEVQEEVHSDEVEAQEDVYSDEVEVQEEVHSDEVEAQEVHSNVTEAQEKMHNERIDHGDVTSGTNKPSLISISTSDLNIKQKY